VIIVVSPRASATTCAILVDSSMCLQREIECAWSWPRRVTPVTLAGASLGGTDRGLKVSLRRFATLTPLGLGVARPPSSPSLDPHSAGSPLTRSFHICEGGASASEGGRKIALTVAFDQADRSCEVGRSSAHD
jgi:hypothetical protein